MLTFDDRLNNALLAGLNEEALGRWRPFLHRVMLSRGQLVGHAGCVLEHVHFPTQAVMALYATTEEGACSELALVGHEGMLGVCSLTVGVASFNNAIVVQEGSCWRMPASLFRQEVLSDPSALQWVLRYTQALVTQVAQTALCNRHHNIDQTLSRWLLMNMDRSHGRPLHMTHELMSRLMGVRREGITEAAARLQRQGLIRYARGRITVIDPVGLEQSSCECYRLVQHEHQRLLGGPHSGRRLVGR